MEGGMDEWKEGGRDGWIPLLLNTHMSEPSREFFKKEINKNHFDQHKAPVIIIL